MKTLSKEHREELICALLEDEFDEATYEMLLDLKIISRKEDKLKEEELVRSLLDDDSGISRKSYDLLLDLSMVSDKVQKEVQSIEDRYFIF